MAGDRERHSYMMGAALVDQILDIPIANRRELPKQRKRKWHSKVRTGCSLCRQRRIKCDESKPGCIRCSRLGRECPGYETPKIWLFEPESSSSPQRDQSPGLQIFHQPSVSLFTHSEGPRSFQFYFEVSEPSVSRFFGAQMASLFEDQKGIDDAIRSTDFFWKIQFPRLVCSVPVLQSCLMLMTASHEHVEKAAYAFCQDPSCIRKYGAAVTHLRAEYAKLSVDCILLGSLLLAMGELAYGPSTAGLTHLYSAAQIIEQRQHNPSTF